MPKARLKVGFVGLGWIGLNRMQAMLATGLVDLVVVYDPSPERVEAIKVAARRAVVAPSFNALLDQDLDAVVIATPNALHASQAIAALERGFPVFCQKPLGRTLGECEQIVAAARDSNALLAIDLSYRYESGMMAIKSLVDERQLGEIFAADLVFHNAYGPDAAWFYDRAHSGGGCVIDLGVHLIDLFLWLLSDASIIKVESRLFSGGAPLTAKPDRVEDYATATFVLSNGCVARLACSWKLQAGQDAVISLDLHGTEGGATFRNVDGSFLDFEARLNRGTKGTQLTLPEASWAGRAACHFLYCVADGQGYDREVESILPVAATIDAIYGRAHGSAINVPSL
jgi:predicted dehydrogenase